MTLEQAIAIIDPEVPLDSEEFKKAFPEIMSANGVDTVDIVITAWDEAIKMACDIMKEKLNGE